MFEAPPEMLKWFQQLTDKQLVEFFYQAVAGRRVIREGEDYYREHLVLAHASQGRDYIDENSESYGPWEPWRLMVLSLRDREEYNSERDDGAIICEYGTCGCGSKVACYARGAKCPVCGAHVFCT